MKRFIIISLLSVMTLPILACAWVDTQNYYLFSVYPYNDFRENLDKITRDNWKAYLGKSESDYFWFDADEIIKAARQKGDALMVSYVENLQKYLDCVRVERNKQYEWNYPSKEEIAQCTQNLRTIRTYALGKTKTKLRSQHALLYMRCNMMLGRHQENVTYWEQTASQFIETVYKDMMKNIYAGALYKTGRQAEAGEMFAEQGDYESLMTQFYKKRSYLAIQQHYKQNPNSKVLPFLLQDFVNNAQEAVDNANEDEIYGKLFVRDINQQESWQMQQFCELVVREGKTETPILWKSAKAWLEYLSGKRQEAAKDIIEAASLEGTERMKDNARVLMLYITASQAKPSEALDDYIADELAWLKEKQKIYQDGFLRNAETRFASQVIPQKYGNDPSRFIALMKATGSYVAENYMDTMRVKGLENYLAYTQAPATTKLDKFLKANNVENDTTLAELIGTKYMRLGQWDNAIMWLKKVPVSFYNNNKSSNYRFYVSRRSYTTELWMKRQWLNESESYDKEWKLWKDPKLTFAKEMQMLEGSMHILSGRTLEKRYYDLAVRYAQASIKGDCWWLMRDFKSWGDTVRVNEVDFAQKALDLLQKVAQSSDRELKEKALFGMGLGELYSGNLWCENVYDSDLHDYVNKYNRDSPQFRAYQALFELVDDKSEEGSYIARCDEFLQFRKYYRKNK